MSQKNDLQSDFIELEREINKGTHSKRSYHEEIWVTVARGRRTYDPQIDFYIVVHFRKQRGKGMETILRRQFHHRKSCPTPEFDQTIYKYHRKEDHVELLWTIPNNVACLNLPLRKKDLPLDQMWLLSFIEDFHSGELERQAARHNKESLILTC